MKRDNSTLKTYFETGDYPTEPQFIDLIDSFLNIEENDAVTGITNNGDDTYTFQLLSGGTETLNLQSLPNDIPIASVVGLQAMLNVINNTINSLAINPNDGQLQITDGLHILGDDLRLCGSGTGASNVASFRIMESNCNVEQARFSIEGGNNLRLINSVSGQSLHLNGSGGFEFFDGSNSHTIWHSGNDGPGSGLNADTVDGLQVSVFVRNDGNSGTRFGGNYLQFNGDGASNNDYIAFNDSTNGYYFNADNARQNTAANAQVHASEFFASGAYYHGDGKRMFQFSDTWLRLNPSNDFTAGIYCGSSILRTDGQLQVGGSGSAFRVTNSGAVSQAGDLTITKNNPWISLDSSSSGSNANEQAAGISIGESGYKGSAALHLTYTGDGRGHIGMGTVTNSEPANLALEFQYQNNYTIFRGNARMENGHTDYYNGNRIRRYSHVGGFMEGSYNTVAVNNNFTNPIYVIGSNYIPNESSLGNMYGIGYSNASAAFLNSTDLGTNPSGWGLYIAADGNARIFLNASNGHGYFGGNVYADNFILSSDKRLKQNIRALNNNRINANWVSFDMKGQKRYGVIAQELEEHHPEFVKTDEKGYKSVAYVDLLVAKNAELEARIEKLEKLIKKLV